MDECSDKNFKFFFTLNLSIAELFYETQFSSIVDLYSAALSQETLRFFSNALHRAENIAEENKYDDHDYL